MNSPNMTDEYQSIEINKYCLCWLRQFHRLRPMKKYLSIIIMSECCRFWNLRGLGTEKPPMIRLPTTTKETNLILFLVIAIDADRGDGSASRISFIDDFEG